MDRRPKQLSAQLLQIVSTERVDLEADLLCAPHLQPHLVAYNGLPTRRIQRAGSHYEESRIEYRDEKRIAAVRIVRRILHTNQTELAYTPKRACPKSITINRGVGKLLLADPHTGTTEELLIRGSEQAVVDVPSGRFYMFEAGRKRAGDLTISELIQHPSYLDDLNTVCPPGVPEVFTQDGLLEIPSNLLHRF